PHRLRRPRDLDGARRALEPGPLLRRSGARPLAQRAPFPRALLHALRTLSGQRRRPAAARARVPRRFALAHRRRAPAAVRALHLPRQRRLAAPQSLRGQQRRSLVRDPRRALDADAAWGPLVARAHGDPARLAVGAAAGAAADRLHLFVLLLQQAPLLPLARRHRPHPRPGVPRAERMARDARAERAAATARLGNIALRADVPAAGL